eukprot:Clim_evm5s139 gene=Clim_evmTU5s139
MVLLAAAVCTKAGKPIVSRQFVEMTRSRIEGLVAAFPKLVGTGSQHTFVETESVRYVYQPMESLFMLLITTKNSNILEDLETLHLFARVLQEYCRVLDEAEVSDNAFELLFAFDEIISLGYRESVNIGQIRQFTEMDSHEEKIFQMVQKNKEREAKEEMKRRMKELEQQRKEAQKMGLGGAGGRGGMGGMGGTPGFGANFGGNMGGGMGMGSAQAMGGMGGFDNPPPPRQPVSTAGGGSGAPSRGMKLGGRAKANDFVDALRAEGESVAPGVADLMGGAGAQAAAQPEAAPVMEQQINRESVHLRMEERIVLSATRDGGVNGMEVKGDLFLNINDPGLAKISIQLDQGALPGVNFKTHPNVDKNGWNGAQKIGLKDPTRPFPVNTDLGVLKWRYEGRGDNDVPLLINCWPTPVGDGTCEINIEYELQRTDLQLQNVQVLIPIQGGQPTVNNVEEGEYMFDPRAHGLIWRIPAITASNASGTLEFVAPGQDANAFFPVHVNYASEMSYCKVSIAGVSSVENGQEVPFSLQAMQSPERYEFA